MDIVNEARSRESRAGLTSFGVDETACKHGQNYVSVFVDMAFRKVLFATAGKDALTIKGFREDFEAHGGAPDKVAEVCCDMSQAFVSGMEPHFPKAHITFIVNAIMFCDYEGHGFAGKPEARNAAKPCHSERSEAK